MRVIGEGAAPREALAAMYQGRALDPRLAVEAPPDDVALRRGGHPRLQPGRRPSAGPADVREGGPRPMKNDAALQAALELRDKGLLIALLDAARTIRDEAALERKEDADRLGLAVFAGLFAEARRHLKTLARAAGQADAPGGLTAAIRLLEERLPAEDWPAAAALRGAVDEALSALSGDPFQIQARLSRLIGGLDARRLPKPLERVQERLAIKHSWLARERVLSRRGPATGPVQRDQDCWIRSIYDLPISALEPLRRAVPYERFLEKVDAFLPSADVRKNGLDVDDFPGLAQALGLKATLHHADQAGLEALLARHGAVIAVVGWFDKSPDDLETWRIWLRHYHQHVVILKGAAKTPEGTRFTAIDSMVPHETGYSMEELGIMRAYFYALEPAGERSAEALLKFAGAGP